MEAVSVSDFPIRDHKGVLKIHRRRLTDTRTGKSFSLPIPVDVVCKGTRYSKEFGAFLLFKLTNKWTEKQKERAKILFEEYPDIQLAYGLSHSLRTIFSKNTMKDAARLSMAQWYNKVDELGIKSFNVIAATFYEHYDDILNFYNNRASNAAADSINAKIKLLRANLHGVADRKFFLFRITKIMKNTVKSRVSAGPI